MSRPPFTPAAELCGAFYATVVRPLLAGRPHAAALLGGGSEVLGYDTARSTDHGWGPRVQVFLDDGADVAACGQLLDARLPDTFRGWPVRHGWDDVPPGHHVEVGTLPAWLAEFLGTDPTEGMSVLDWLLTPQQRLLGVVSGAVYHDPSGALRAVRRTLRWYPGELPRWLLACQWHRVAQEEAFVARTAEVGDATGSSVTAARLVRDLMRLALLLDRRYAPYAKWLGTAFARMPSPDDLPRHLVDAVHAPDRSQRESALADAYAVLARRQNASGLAVPVDVAIGDYHGRPAQVLMADRVTEVLHQSVADAALQRLPLIGSVDQWVDSADVLSSPRHYRRLAAAYGDDPTLRAVGGRSGRR